MYGSLPLARSRGFRARTQLDCADEFKSFLVRDGERRIIAGKRVVIGDRQRIKADATSFADKIRWFAGAVGPVGVCM